MTNYNLTNYTNADTVLEVAVAANALTNGVLFIVILSLVWVVAFTNLLSRYDTADAILSSSLLTMIAAAMLFFTGLVSEAVLLGVFVIFIFSVIGRALN